MTELSFLIELLLNHELKKETKDLIASRIKEVEGKLTAPAQSIYGPAPTLPTYQVTGPKQAPSTLALMAKHGDFVAPPIMPPIEEPQPVAVVAQTPQTAAAMNSRNQAIAEAIAGKIDKTTGRPKKW